MHLRLPNTSAFYPTDKVSVVLTFVGNRYSTLMCGDGQTIVELRRALT
jgi:hypothetical protein